MTTKLSSVIGVEIHLELLTKTKMFSSAPNNFHSPPNRNIHPLDLGYLGTLPRPNKQAVIFAIKLAKALNMKINDVLLFDRKHYFYPDLPKSYQITQQFQPIATEGFVLIKDEEGNDKKIAISEIKLEEDTAKQIHKGHLSFLDYNRCGIPLIEIVTQPVFKNALEVTNYVNLIRKITRTLKISNAKMEEGSLRVDVNVSLSRDNTRGTKVEIKNINTISNINKAINNELKIQEATLLSGKKVRQETKRFDEKLQKNVFMRKKETALDYHYIPETNIPPIKLSKSFIDSIQIEELPWASENRLLALGLKRLHVNSLVSNNRMLKYFESIDYPNKIRLANIFFNDVVSLVNAKKISFKNLKILPNQISEAIKLLDENYISSNQLKDLFKLIEEKVLKESVYEICERFEIKQINDDSFVEKLVNEAIDTHKQFLLDNKTNHKKIFGFLLGQIVKVSKNKVSPQLVAKKVNEKINKL